MLFLLLLAVFQSPVAKPQLLEGLLDGNPQVELDYGTFKGNTVFQGVDSFLGIPFAKAGRYENPTVMSSADKLSGVQDATMYGKACPQAELVAAPLGDAEVGALLGAVEELAFGPLLDQGEDCLSINVQIPAGINSTAGLPIMFWIHGGGYELGASAAFASETTAVPGLIYQGAGVVQRSVEMGQPVVFVSANYRLNAFGGLASQEITDAGVANLILKDQRAAMQWIQNYIQEFGGDKSKVTLFGESAGSMSVAYQLVLNDGDNEGFFRAAIMASGAIAKFKDYHHAQSTFDLFAERSNCGSAADKVDCLRKADYDTLYDALQQFSDFFSYNSTAVPWYPRADGTYLKDSPHRLLREGKVAHVPYIIGDMKDEGTLFSLVPSLNVTTDEYFQSFFRQNYFQDIDAEQLKAFTDLYSQDPSEGSPFDTGNANAIGPQYKRLAAAVGDYSFQSGRRDLLNYTEGQQPAWTYMIEQSIPLLGQVQLLENLTGLPLLGSFHVSDVVLNDFGFVLPPSVSQNTRNIMSTFISFVNTLDPNNHGLADIPYWPRWNSAEKTMFRYKEDGPDLITDDYREAQMAFINGDADTYVS